MDVSKRQTKTKARRCFIEDMLIIVFNFKSIYTDRFLS